MAKTKPKIDVEAAIVQLANGQAELAQAITAISKRLEAGTSASAPAVAHTRVEESPEEGALKGQVRRPSVLSTIKACAAHSPEALGQYLLGGQKHARQWMREEAKELTGRGEFAPIENGINAQYARAVLARISGQSPPAKRGYARVYIGAPRTDVVPAKRGRKS